ncbi:MAG TPA: hypothetical protein VK741_02340 [Acetobacteraceae bacterium]|nr:hypothetical protein [Acetobacteraceae bacterium]
MSAGAYRGSGLLRLAALPMATGSVSTAVAGPIATEEPPAALASKP